MHIKQEAATRPASHDEAHSVRDSNETWSVPLNLLHTPKTHNAYSTTQERQRSRRGRKKAAASVMRRCERVSASGLYNHESSLAYALCMIPHIAQAKSQRRSSARPRFATGRRRGGRLVVIPAQIAVIAQFPSSRVSLDAVHRKKTLHERGRSDKGARPKENRNVPRPNQMRGCKYHA